MSSSSPHPLDAPGGEPDVAVPRAVRPWSVGAELRRDLRAGLAVVAVLAVAGLAAGLVWWWLAPRADFRITAGGPVPVGHPSEELLVADDVVFALVCAGLGLLAGLAVWWWRRSRGMAALLGLAVGTAAGGAVAWQLGELLGPGPTKAELSRVGATVTTGLSLDSLPALAVGPFVAVLVYVLATVLNGTDDLGRPSVDGHGHGELLQGRRHGAEGAQEGELAAQQP